MLGAPLRGSYRSLGRARGKPLDEAPPAPLDELTLNSIKELVQSRGGSLGLGHICHDFPGVKRLQLQDHFDLNRVGNQWVVSLPPDLLEQEDDLAAQVLAASQGLLGVKMEFPKPTREPDFLEAAPLDDTQVEAVATVLEANGGALPLGRVTQLFPRIKKTQLDLYFELNRVGNDGQWEVRLPGVAGEGVEMMLDGKAVPKDTPLPPLDEGQVAAIRTLLEREDSQSLPITKVFEACPGVKRGQLADHFEVTRVDKKRFMVSLSDSPGVVDARRPPLTVLAGIRPLTTVSPVPPTGPPPALRATPSSAPLASAPAPPLDPEIVQQVRQLVDLCGGTANMGRVSAAFKHIKLSQLEEHFTLVRVRDQWQVQLPEESGQAGKVVSYMQSAPPRLPTRPGPSRLAPTIPRPSSRPTNRVSVFGPLTGSSRAPLPTGALLPPLKAPVPWTTPRVRPSSSRGLPSAPAVLQDEPPPPLDPEVLHSIEILIEEAGGSAPMGRVSQAFMGVKRAQLQEHFDLQREGDQWRVSIPAEKRGLSNLYQPAAKRLRL